MPVIVRRSDAAPVPNAYGEYYLVEAVARFAEHAAERAGRGWDAIPPEALQVNCVFDYVGQVENGGHSQFVANRRGELSECLSNVAAGLRAVGADGNLAIIEDLRAWLAGNPDEAARQTGFAGGRAAALDALDDRFRALWKAGPLDATLAAWIAAWPNLRVVEDADYDAAIRQLLGTVTDKGNRFATAKAEQIARAVEKGGIADADMVVRTAVALDLLLRIAGFQNAMVDLRPDAGQADAPEGPSRWMVFCDLAPHFAIVGEVAVLVAVGADTPAARATHEEIEAHRRLLEGQAG
ncbi:DUF4375 domain-containing protein [Oricola sp.]|uniref:DMP19 family protein n=1 Tax=Oricola sp. TaxID=1979950 RepID=UPI0025CC69B2|nr:DUF4375 domain-containing protein [Oricola sp.]MCI5077856.1 DMP19 family protein [Oricola sp.]